MAERLHSLRGQCENLYGYRVLCDFSDIFEIRCRRLHVAMAKKATLKPFFDHALNLIGRPGTGRLLAELNLLR